MFDFLLRFIDLKDGRVFFVTYTTQLPPGETVVGLVNAVIERESKAKPYCVISFVAQGMPGEFDHWMECNYSIEEWTRGGM